MRDAAEGVRGGTRAESSPATLGSRASRPAHRDGVLRDRHLGVARREPQLHPLVGQRREDLGLEQARVLLDEHLLSARLRVKGRVRVGPGLRLYYGRRWGEGEG